MNIITRWYRQAKLRRAIYRAADLIEHNPSRYKFFSVHIPQLGDRQCRACMLGWIGYFAGIRESSILSVARAMGMNDLGDEFYKKIADWGSRLSLKTGPLLASELLPREAAFAMRCYAREWRMPS